MRILLLTQWFNPEPIFKGLTFAKALRERGHDVTVLTSLPHYPLGRLYPGYAMRPFVRESMDGIDVIRTFAYPSYDRSVLRRAVTYLSFMVSASIATLFLKRFDIVYVYHPPATVSLPALVMRFVKRTPFVYDVQDLWPDTLRATGMMSNRALSAIVGWWCDLTYRSASRIVVLSPGFRDAISKRGVDSGKISVIYNWSDERQMRYDSTGPGTDVKEGFTILFAGTMGAAQALDAVLDAAAEARHRLPEVTFKFIGSGTDVERLRARALETSLSNVTFMERRPMSEMASILGAADALLVHLKDDPLFEITIPSKTQAYMAAGRPILMAVRGDAAALVQRAGCGVVAEPQNPQSLLAALERLVRMSDDERAAMGQRGQAFYRDVLSLECGVSSFMKIFEDVINESRAHVA